MRVAFGLAGLAFAVVATGACEEPHSKQPDAVECMAFLALQSTAISEGRAEGDLAALDAAGAAWRALAERKFGADEAAQYFASTVAVFNEAGVADIETLSARCAFDAANI